MKKFGIFLIIGVFIFSCSPEQKDKNPQKEEASQPSVNREVEVPKEDPLFAEGQRNYQTHCMTCHMKDGYGVPNLNPPLAETDWVNGDVERLIDIVLNGREGEIEVNGEIYNGVMIPHSHLTDQEIATILTYIRASFGNNSGPISEEQVASVRAKP